MFLNMETKILKIDTKVCLGMYAYIICMCYRNLYTGAKSMKDWAISVAEHWTSCQMPN